MQIGERLADIRKDNKDTQAVLAAKLGVSVETIRGWEQEKNCISVNKLQKICRLYGVSADFILGLNNEDPLISRLSRLDPQEEEVQYKLREIIRLLKGKDKDKEKKK
ncbi:MAG: helix-turn-helix transcriptional regulator [Firmicutes bacterium]|nr:helix-turn-helix transcriptional regulator [Bacillota bacterium]